MALIQYFDILEQDDGKLHLPVVAKLGMFERDGKAFVQINTYGRPDRQFPQKVSQSIQLDAQSAGQLIALLKKAFPGV